MTTNDVTDRSCRPDVVPKKRGDSSVRLLLARVLESQGTENME
jgi:hypothetical protein